MLERKVQHLTAKACTIAYTRTGRPSLFHWAGAPRTRACPGRKDVKEGIIAYKIAVHAADIARIRTGSSRSRSNPKLPASMHDETLPEHGPQDMCGPAYCSTR